MTDADADRTVACTITPDQAASQAETVSGRLTSAFDRAEERPDGVDVYFAGTEETLEAVAAFVATEHVCCSFADYTIEVAHPHEETRLSITGPEGTAEMFSRAFVDLLEGGADETGG